MITWLELLCLHFDRSKDSLASYTMRMEILSDNYDMQRQVCPINSATQFSRWWQIYTGEV